MARSDPKASRIRKWCPKCDRSRDVKHFGHRTGRLCQECFDKLPANNGPKVGDEFDASKVQAASERLILEMRAKCGMR